MLTQVKASVIWICFESLRLNTAMISEDTSMTRAINFLFVLTGLLTVYAAARTGAAATVAPADMARVYHDLLLIILAGGFGGFVHGMLRHVPNKYLIVWPFINVKSEFGFLGDVFVGVAAGTSIFFIMESLFGLHANNLTDEQTYLKFIALGVICGYMGSSLLDGLTLLISKRLVKARRNFEEEELAHRKLEARIAAASKSWK